VGIGDEVAGHHLPLFRRILRKSVEYAANIQYAVIKKGELKNE
jgi:hypothetical protein